MTAGRRSRHPAVSYLPRVGVIEISPQDGRAMFDRAAKEHLGISGEEFLAAYDAGEYGHCIAVNQVLMLLPFARPGGAVPGENADGGE